MDTANVRPAPTARLWAVAFHYPNVRVGPYASRRDAARLLARLLARHPHWRGRVAPWS